MQNKAILLITICISTILAAQKITDNFSGKWKTEEGIIIEITKYGSSYNGKPTNKNVLILKDLTFKNGLWSGVLTNPQKNITVKCEAYIEGSKIKFIAKRGLVKKEIFWTKEN